MALKTKDFSVTGTSSGGGITYTYILRVTENSINKAKNTSNVTVQAILKQNYSGTAFYSWSTGVSCTINGKELFSDYRQRDLSGTGEQIYYTWTGDLAHNTDGKLTLSVTGKLWQADPASYSPPAMTVPKGNLTLTDIPRASSVGASDANIESHTAIVITRQDSSFTHSIAYAFGNLSGYITANGSTSSTEVKLSATTVSFLIPKSFYAQIPNDPYGVCTLTVTTYSGTTAIGTATTTFRATADKSLCKPSLTPTVTDYNETTKALTGNAATLVRYFSTARCVVLAQGKNGATVKSITINGKTADDDTLFENTETGKFTFRVVDSRGYIAETTTSNSLVPYVELTCNPTAVRTAPTSSKAVLTIKGNCWKGNFGSADNTFTCKYRFAGGAWKTLSVTPGSDHGYSVSVTLTDVDYTKSYSLEISVADKLSTITKTVTLRKGLPVFDWGETAFHFHVPISIEDQPVADFVVSHGKEDAWYYRKWNSGLAECWYRKQFTADVTTVTGSLYTSGPIALTDVAFPFSFMELPSITATLAPMENAGFLSPSGGLTTDKTGAYRIFRPTAITGGTYRICYHVVGIWK